MAMAEVTSLKQNSDAISNIIHVIKEIAEHNFSFESSHRFHSIHSAYWWLRCLFWKSQESNIVIKGYKKILERHILKKPFFLDLIDRIFNPILGKSIAFYFIKK